MHNSLNYRLIAANALVYLLILYFIAHSFTGDRGLIAYSNYRKQFKELQAQSQDIEHELEELNNKVLLLNSKSVNLDLVEELAKKNLGYAHRKEKILMVDFVQQPAK
jgi:cell division protein FtsB